jgi:hypothetical protein
MHCLNCTSVISILLSLSHRVSKVDNMVSLNDYVFSLISNRTAVIVEMTSLHRHGLIPTISHQISDISILLTMTLLAAVSKSSSIPSAILGRTNKVSDSISETSSSQSLSCSFLAFADTSGRALSRSVMSLSNLLKYSSYI